MIDFKDCTIHALCHPARFHSDKLSTRLETAVLEYANDKSRDVDDMIEAGDYSAAISALDEMISRFEELEADIKSDSEAAHRLTFEEVDKKSYHGKIVRAADEYGEAQCTLGALKAAKQDLESSSV